MEANQLGAIVMAALICMAPLSPALGSSKEQLSSRECKDLGFTGLTLRSDCNTLAEYIKDQDKLFWSRAGGLHEKLVFYPEITGFIEEEKDRFPFRKVQYIFNSAPKLIMLDDSGQQKETISVDNWKRKHILQFLREKISGRFQTTIAGAVMNMEILYKKPLAVFFIAKVWLAVLVRFYTPLLEFGDLIDYSELFS